MSYAIPLWAIAEVSNSKSFQILQDPWRWIFLTSNIISQDRLSSRQFSFSSPEHLLSLSGRGLSMRKIWSGCAEGAQIGAQLIGATGWVRCRFWHITTAWSPTKTFAYGVNFQNGVPDSQYFLIFWSLVQQPRKKKSSSSTAGISLWDIICDHTLPD